MTSLFAPQFNFAPLYNQHQLPLSAPTKINIRTPDPGDDPGNEGEPSDTGSSKNANIGKSLGADAASSLGLSQQNKNMTNLPVGIRDSRMNAMSMQAQAPDPQTSSYQGMGGYFDKPVSSPSDVPSTNRLTVSPPLATMPTGPSWGQVGHDIAHGWDTVVNGLSAAFPLPGVSSQNKVTPHSTDSGVTEPSNVWNPSEDSQAYTNTSMGAGGQQALGSAPYSPQFKASFGRDWIQQAQQESSQPSSTSLWNDFDNVIRNPGEIFADL